MATIYAAPELGLGSAPKVYRRYRVLALAWGLVFLVVGTAFLLAPTLISEGLTALGQLVGLSGAIPTGSGSLWHVLTASLMATLTVLAWQSAFSPEAVGAFGALVVAKCVSVIGFLYLASHDSVWSLCALADAVVATSLWLTRRADERPARVPLMARYLAHRGKAGAYASYVENVRGLPLDIRVANRLVSFLFMWLAPLLFMRIWSRAAFLTASEFERFCFVLERHPHRALRVGWLLVAMPASAILAVG
jgi:hypothetical protein